MKMEWEEFKEAENFNYGSFLGVTLGATSETILTGTELAIKGGASAGLKAKGIWAEMAFPSIVKLDINLGNTVKIKKDETVFTPFISRKSLAEAKAKRQELKSALTTADAAVAKAGRAEKVMKNAATKLDTALGRIRN